MCVCVIARQRVCEIERERVFVCMCVSAPGSRPSSRHPGTWPGLLTRVCAFVFVCVVCGVCMCVHIYACIYVCVCPCVRARAYILEELVGQVAAALLIPIPELVSCYLLC